MGAVARDRVEVPQAERHLALVPAVDRNGERRVVGPTEVGIDGVGLKLCLALVALLDGVGEASLGLGDAVLHVVELCLGLVGPVGEPLVAGAQRIELRRHLPRLGALVLDAALARGR